MATQKAANIARDQFSDSLRNLGAHGIAVDQIEHEGKKTFAVIAFLEKQADDIPDSVQVVINKKKQKVPVVVRLVEKFKPE